MTSIAVYMPVRNAEVWAENLVLVEGAHYVAFDSGSSDNTVAVLKSKGVEVHQHPEPIGRVENWNSCLQHFGQSQYDWMKWLFTGDELKADLVPKLQRAIQTFPEAGLIAAAYEVATNDGQLLHRFIAPVSEVRSSVDALMLSIGQGNWFGSPIGHAFRRDTVRYASLGTMPWVADWHLCQSVAARFPTLVLAELLGTFNMQARSFYSTQENKPYSHLQEWCIRYQAIDLLRSLGAAEGEAANIERALDQAVTANLRPPQ
jgi:hypothetical protein